MNYFGKFCMLLNFRSNFHSAFNSRKQILFLKMRLFSTTKSERKKNLALTIQQIMADPKIEKYLQKENVQWDQMKAFIVESPEVGSTASPHSALFLACTHLKLFDVGISYYKYIEDNGVRLSSVETIFLLKFLSSVDREFKKDEEEIIIKLFHEIKSQITSNPVMQEYCAILFSRIRTCWEEMANICLTKFILGVINVIVAAFDWNEFEIGMKLLQLYPSSLSQIIVEAYFNYCIRKAEAGQFSVDFINEIVDFCNKNVFILPDVKVHSYLVKLTSILNEDSSKKYFWKAVKCHVHDKTSICDSCGNKLKNIVINSEEFLEMKKSFMKDVFISKNINIKTSEKEVLKFMLFLKNCKPYDVVVDFLNIYYSFNDPQKVFKILRNVRNTNEILFIAKKHVTRFSNFNYIKKNFQVFLTENSSDDDIFVMYAAMSGGENTYFLTSDFYRGYKNLLTDFEFRKIFLKWQLSHHYRIIRRKVYGPLPHVLLPQKTCSPKTADEKESYCWHVSSQSSVTPSVNPLDNFSWVCLTATPT